jgi:AsmA protein
MSLPVKKIILRTLKAIGLTLAGCIALLFLIPYLFPQAVNSKIDKWVNSNINGKISVSKTRLSFFKHFPSLTLTLYDVNLMGSEPFAADTLVDAHEISLGVDLSSVFKSKITINKIYLSNAFINIQVDSLGRANYNIYKGTQTANAPVDTNGGASLGIKEIKVENSRLVYQDMSLPMTIKAKGFNYLGSGDLSKDIFDLNSHTDIKSLDFYYARQPYVVGKKINADLVTEVNTKSLAFIFKKNNLLINQLPVDFSGRFGFIQDGYEMDFSIVSNENDLDDIVSALPQNYQDMLAKTEINGAAVIKLGLTGKYVVKDSLAPSLNMSMQIRNGFIDNEKSPAPLRNLYMNLTASLPGLNPDSLRVDLDSLYFNIGDGYFGSDMHVKGIKEPYISARINSELDLEKWNKALGIKPIQMRGKYAIHLSAEGKYATGIVHEGLRKTDTVVTSIPRFNLRSSFTNGYFKYASLPEAISNIAFDLDAQCPDNNYKHITAAVSNLNISALDNYIKGYFKLANTSDFPIDAAIHAKVNLDDIKKFYPLDSLKLSGMMNTDITAKGNFLPAKKQYPVIAANFSLKDGAVQTKYYPHPVENIQISTTISDKTGDLKGLDISLQPISFTFENEPFTLKADLHDFTDLSYKIHLKGNINVGNIYQVFARQGYNVSGIIAANLFLKGTQKDITQGNYDKLVDKGSLSIQGLSCSTELYPKPFVISKGIFRFNEDKIRLDTFTVNYGNSTLVLNGYVSNIINYYVKPGSVLKGELDLDSKQLVVDEFMAYASSPEPATAQPSANAAPASSGVVLVPKDLDLTFKANVETAKYNGMVFKDIKGLMYVRNDSIVLKQMAFSLVDAPVNMDADYTALNPKKAYFDYHITANDFDVHKAYKNIKMFHDMASSAEHAEGLISLDYELSGLLNGDMTPIYPSLKGGGVISAKKVQMHGFKLFNAIGKKAGQDSLGGNSGVSKINIKSHIENNVITIERTKLKISIFRVKFEGKVSFDKHLDLKFRLGLPPMGLIGIPMAITGTEDDPKIHIGKDKDEDVKETTEEGDN